MSKPFDATLKELIRAYPADWLAQLGVPITEPPEVLSADLSTVTAAADTLIRVGDRVVHIDVESGPDDSLARRMLLYNVLAHHHTGLPVHTVAVLLRSKARGANLTDRLAYEGLTFRFDLVRIWETPADVLLRGGVGLLPLAVLGKPAAGLSRQEALPSQIERITDRVEREAKGDRDTLMAATFILASIHVAPAAAREVINHVLNMKDLPGYQFLVKESEIEGARALLLKQGEAKFGKPTDKQEAKLKAIQDSDRLERIAVKMLSAKSWDGLLRVQ